MFISLISLDEKITTKLELELETQNNNIEVDFAKKIPFIKDSTPALDWNYQDWGPAKSQEAIENIFSDFKNDLAEFTQNKNPVGIYYSVKDVVLRLNALQKAGFIIDTGEREELCLSIDTIVSATGFRTYGMDITGKWRNW